MSNISKIICFKTACGANGSELVVGGEKKREMTEENKNCCVAERVFGSFRRILSLPEDVNINDIRASHKGGVLRIPFPRKAEALPEVKKIEIPRPDPAYAPERRPKTTGP